jgi:lauroyl/myristoyl acyltransferase
MALDFFERMDVQVLMVRGGRPLQLSRTLFRALTSGTLVAALVDNVRPPERAVAVNMFGQPVGLAPWAAKIATHLKVPVVPGYARSRGSGVAMTFGEPIVTDDVQAAVEHYAGFFARSILEDPASWAYLADRKWNRVLRSAGERQ